MADVAPFGDSLVAVGRGANAAPIALVSGETASWSVEHVPTIDERAPTQVVAFGDRALAIGAGGADCAHPQADGMWVRSGGGTWTEAPFDQLFCAGGEFDAAANATTAVIVGTSAGATPYVWSSVDGLHWTDRSSVFAGLAPEVVGAIGDGFAAFGSGPSGVWVSTSARGATWSAPQVTVPVTDARVLAAGALGGQTVAVITTSSGSVGLLRFAGGSWTSTGSPGLDGRDLVRVIVADDGLIALGNSASGAAAWVSADGVAWRSVVLPKALRGSDAIITGAAANGDRAAIVGTVPASDGSVTGGLWTGPASLLAP